MADITNIVKLGIDAYKGNVEKYSVKQGLDTLREALVAANGGSTTLDYRKIRDGECNGLFAIVETILSRTIVDGLQGNEFFMNLVDFRNIAEGDKNEFVCEDRNLFEVSVAANGTTGIRRQRLGGATTTSIATSYYTIRVYEELSRVLGGAIDFNKFIDDAGKAFQKKILSNVYSLWTSATSTALGGEVYFPVAGTYSEDTLLTTVEHVQAAAGGAPATIVGTPMAVRKMASSLSGVGLSDAAKDDYYKMGYAGKLAGVNVVSVPQLHQTGSTNFQLNDKSLAIIAGDDKPLKVVYEGQSIIIPGNPLDNADLTQEYLYGDKVGMGLVLCNGNAGIGRYDFT